MVNIINIYIYLIYLKNSIWYMVDRVLYIYIDIHVVPCSNYVILYGPFQVTEVSYTQPQEFGFNQVNPQLVGFLKWGTPTSHVFFSPY